MASTDSTNTTPDLSLLDNPRNRELLIALLDNAAKRYRLHERRTARGVENMLPVEQWREEAESAEALSALFEGWTRG